MRPPGWTLRMQMNPQLQLLTLLPTRRKLRQKESKDVTHQFLFFSYRISEQRELIR